MVGSGNLGTYEPEFCALHRHHRYWIRLGQVRFSFSWLMRTFTAQCQTSLLNRRDEENVEIARSVQTSEMLGKQS